MKRWEMVLAAVGLLLAVLGGWHRTSDPQLRTQFQVQADDCRVPVTQQQMPGTPSLGDAVILHGLSANSGVMTALARELVRNGFTAYLLDLSGHGNNTDPFTFAQAGKCAEAALRALADRGAIHPDHAVLIGHSLGGDIAILVASRVPFASTVAISPGPLVPVPAILDQLRPYAMPPQLPRNLLVIVGDVDLPTFETAARQLIERNGGPREAPTDFMAGTALGMRTIPWATHTGLVFRRETAPQILFWFLRGWNRSATFVEAGRAEWLRAALPLGWLLLFPVAASLCAKLAGIMQTPAAQTESSHSPLRALGAWMGSAVVLAVLLHWFIPFAFLRLATGDYLASFLFLHAVLFWLLQRQKLPELNVLFSPAGKSGRAMLSAVLLGVFVMLTLGWAVSGDWGDLRLNPARWWRFLILAPLLLPYFLLEEHLLGDTTAGARGAYLRITAYFIRRGLLWMAMLAALLLLHGQEILVMVLGLVFLGFSLAQWLAGNAVRRRFACPEATATFNAILAAWFLAGVFPLK